MRFGSLFTGVGGFDLGFQRAGMECAWMCESDAACVRVLRERFPGIHVFGDVREVTRDSVAALGGEPVDLICGGFPCVDVSQAGRRAGLAGERSGLWWEFHRVLDELRPRWAVIENVPGLLSSGQRRDMGAILGALGDLGYGYAYRVLDSQYFGLAQRRKRVFIVGNARDWAGPAEVLLEPEGRAGNPPTRRAKGEESAAAPQGATGGGCVSVSDGTGITSTLRGFGHGWQGQHNSTNSVAATLHTETGNKMNAEDMLPSVAWCLQERDAKGPDSDTKEGHLIPDLADPLTAVSPMREGTNNFKLRNCIPFDTTQITHPANRSRCEPGSPSHTLPTNGHPPAVAFRPRFARNGRGAPREDVSYPLTAEPGRTGNGDSAQVVGQPSVGVRRLTPTECERLQGFPDGWTDVGGSSDSSRYRQMGNAVSVPVAEWIGRRIARVHAS